MIFLFFVPGMFGHTTEFVIRRFSNEYYDKNSIIHQTPSANFIASDGSMHTYRMEMHSFDHDNIPELKENTIVTPIYPTESNNLSEIIKKFEKINNFNDSHKIVVHANNFESAEFNLLVQYKKVVSLPHNGEKVMFSNSAVNQWNKEYNSFKDMQQWELREWFSLYYPNWIDKWIKNADEVDSTYLKISNRDYLSNTRMCFKKIFDHCNLTFNTSLTNEYHSFIDTWLNAQQPIVHEYTLTNNIVDAVIKNYYYEWKDLNIIQEAIVQKKLRDHNIEIKCYDLNVFPCNTIDLKSVLLY